MVIIGDRVQATVKKGRRSPQRLLIIDALGAGDAAGTTAELEPPGCRKFGLDPAQVKTLSSPST
jgi:hypothetical protein